MLRLSGLSVSYGGLHALADVALEVGEGEFVTIVGPNGAGKTTLLKAIGGGVPAGGGVGDRGGKIARRPSPVRAPLGLPHGPGGRQGVSPPGGVRDLGMGAYPAGGPGARAGGPGR